LTGLSIITSSSADPEDIPFFLSIFGRFLIPAVFRAGPSLGSTFRDFPSSLSDFGARLFGDPDCKNEIITEYIQIILHLFWLAMFLGTLVGELRLGFLVGDPKTGLRVGEPPGLTFFGDKS